MKTIYTVEDVAHRLGIGPSTLYRYQPVARHAVREAGASATSTGSCPS